MFGKVMNNIDGGVEVLDDLNDHWTAKNHKQERSIVMEDLQDLAIDKSLRVTILRYASSIARNPSMMLTFIVAMFIWLPWDSFTLTPRWAWPSTRIHDTCRTSSLRRLLTPLRRI